MGVLLLIFHIKYESVPNENEWIFVAQNSVKDSVTKVKSYGEENEKLKVIANGAFNSFAEFAKKSLSEIIEQVPIFVYYY
jgi:hypothetical protein